MLPRHHRKRADVGPPELRVVFVVMVMRAGPDTRRAQAQSPHRPHEHPRQPRVRQNRMVLLVVVDHKKPQEQQSGKNAANDPPRHARVRQGNETARERQAKKNQGGQHHPPTPQGTIRGEGLCSEDEGLPRTMYCKQVRTLMAEGGFVQ